MSGPFGSHNFMTKGTPPESNQSLRFNDNDSAYLSWTPASAGNRKTWTWSGWVKRGNLGTTQQLFHAKDGANYVQIGFTTADKLQFQLGTPRRRTNRLFRDVGAWYHIVAVLDTTDATGDDRLQLWVNGERQTSFDEDTDPTLNADYTVNNTVQHHIGRGDATHYADGYLAEVNFVDGTALDPTSFGETDANGQWVPIIAPSVTYGTNGFYLPFTNDYSVEGFNTVTYRGTGGTQYVGGVGFEPDLVWVKNRGSSAGFHWLNDSVRGVGYSLRPDGTGAEIDYTSYFTSFDSDGLSFAGGTTGFNASSNNFVAWSWDMGTVTNLVTNGDFDEGISDWTTTQGTVTWDAASRRAYLQGPSGVSFEQTITGLDTSKTYYYKASLRRTSGTGNFGVDVDGTLDYVSGSSYTNYTASGLFTPSTSSITFEVWGGSGLYLYADDIEIFEANEDGSITSSVKANPDYGQSIVSYTGISGTGTIGHGLSQTPELIICKVRSTTDNWPVYHSSAGDGYLILDGTNAFSSSAGYWGTPDSTTFGVAGTGTRSNNRTGQTHIAYCFHSVAGYSDFGSYTGNGSSTGPTVTTGFAPAFVLVKNTSTVRDWKMFDNTRDPYGDITAVLEPNTSDVEGTSRTISFTSTGFQIKDTSADVNENGSNFIYMAFADKREAAFWLDQSGNNNDWTNNNMQESDISLDSPTNNFATLNPLDRHPSTYLTLSEGNLLVNGGPTTGYTNCGSTFYQSTGKWYVEFIQKSRAASTWTAIGLVEMDVNHNGYLGQYTGTYAYLDNGGFYYNGSSASTGTSYAVGDVIAYAVDFDIGEIKMYKNNTLVYTFSSLATGVEYAFGGFGYSSSDSSVINFGQDSSFAGNKVAQGNQDANGKGDFYYEPPAGYLALCTDNLPDPAIADGTEHFNTATWTGTGASNSITGVGFQPDLVWTKCRSTATTAHTLNNVVSGVDKYLVPSRSSAEATLATLMTSFDSDGFTLGTHGLANTSGRTYVGWSWKADNTSGASNTDGTITSTVSANPTAGFSIVGYTGNGTAGATIGHGLSSAPEIIITKNRTNALNNWWTYVSELGAGNSLLLNGTYASYADTTVWNNTAPTASVFSVGTATETNGSSTNIIAYCFHGVEGYSKFGSYTGNGSTDGPFVYTGFRPAFLMVKRTDAVNNWPIQDNVRNEFNVVDKTLYADLENSESDLDRMDFLSNGFKLRNTYAENNASGGTYIYMAFAESPFKYSNAR